MATLDFVNLVSSGSKSVQRRQWLDTLVNIVSDIDSGPDFDLDGSRREGLKAGMLGCWEA